jgi:hypothetical protein
MTQATDTDMRALRDLILGLDKKLDGMDKRLEVFQARTDERFNSIDQRFNSIDQRLGSREDRTKSQDSRLCLQPWASSQSCHFSRKPDFPAAHSKGHGWGHLSRSQNYNHCCVNI